MKSSSQLRVAASCAAAAALVAGLLGCSGGAPDPLAPGTATDTYMLARVTVLDGSRACLPGDCDPEFYACLTRAAVAIGTTYDMRATVSSSGLTVHTPGATSFTVAITGTDTLRLRGVAIEFRVTSLPTPSAVITGALSGVAAAAHRNATYADIDLGCTVQNSLGHPESRYLVADFASMPNASVTLTEVPVDATGAVILAQPDGRGGFSPASTIAGTFSFEALGRQTVLADTLIPRVRVEGCFRVPLPFPERAVSVTPAPLSPAAGCP